MIIIKDKYVFAMAVVRFVSALLEFTVAMLFLRLNDIRWALRINAAMGLIGPLIFITVSMLGIMGAAGKIYGGKLLLIIAGVILVLLGTIK